MHFLNSNIYIFLKYVVFCHYLEVLLSNIKNNIDFIILLEFNFSYYKLLDEETPSNFNKKLLLSYLLVRFILKYFVKNKIKKKIKKKNNKIYLFL